MSHGTLYNQWHYLNFKFERFSLLCAQATFYTVPRYFHIIYFVCMKNTKTSCMLYIVVLPDIAQLSFVWIVFSVCCEKKKHFIQISNNKIQKTNWFFFEKMFDFEEISSGFHDVFLSKYSVRKCFNRWTFFLNSFTILFLAAIFTLYIMYHQCVRLPGVGLDCGLCSMGIVVVN